MPKKKSKGKQTTAEENRTTKPPPDPSDHYVRCFQIWAKSNISKIIKFCQQLDADKDTPGTLSVQQFLGCLFDLKAPLSRDELQKICTFFAKDEGGHVGVNYFEFKECVNSGQLLLLYTQSQAHEKEEGKSELSDLSSASGVVDQHLPLKTVHYQCADCNILRSDIPVEVNPIVINIRFVLSTFHHTPTHPGHFTACVLASQTVEGLKIIIKDHLQGSVRSVALFKELPCVEKNFMRPHHDLHKYLPQDITKGTDQHVVDMALYYDYSTECEQDSVLMAENGLFNIKPSGLHVKRM